ncbi:MAG: regulatory iron-sulfur-containing complex subunit RicT [Planctomycetota bacterium]
MPRYIVRHGVMRQLGVFSSRSRDRYARGQQVIARTSRGQEAGEVLCEATEHVLSQMSDPRTGNILRLMSHDDEVELRKIKEQAQRELDACKRRIAEIGLDMELVDAEHLYGGERVVFYYLAEGRVDFRELVKVLAKEFHTRIEMRQIGVRDEAKLLADYGDCGKPVCCNTHLPEMPPVSMKMAKLQKATLDPTKISGRCGRLKCCLRYEYDTYRGMQKDLPRVGAEIITNEGRAKVLAQEVLAGQVLIQTEDMRRIVVDVSQVLSVLPKAGRSTGSGEEGRASKGKAESGSDDTATGDGDRSRAANEKPRRQRGSSGEATSEKTNDRTNETSDAVEANDGEEPRVAPGKPATPTRTGPDASGEGAEGRRGPSDQAGSDRE